MKTLTITLPPDLEKLLEEKVASGEYHAPTEVIHEGLRLIRERDAVKQLRREELRREINIGLEQIARGEVAPLDMEALIAEARERRASRNGK